MKLRLLVPIAACVALRLAAQSTATAVYAESFRQGSTHIVEESFQARLTPENPSYRERVKDSHGDDRYLFSIVPQAPEGDTRITSWIVKMADLHHPIYDNVLLLSPEPSVDPKDDQKNALWRLDPSRFAQVPILATRIMKVEHFYVVLRVKAYHCTPLDSPYLDSMAVELEFRNTDPRKADTSEK